MMDSVGESDLLGKWVLQVHLFYSVKERKKCFNMYHFHSQSVGYVCARARARMRACVHVRVYVYGFTL